MTTMLPTKTSLMFIFILQFKACVFTTVLSSPDRVVYRQALQLVCTYSTAIATTSLVYVNWVENGTIRGIVDKTCDDTFGRVDTTQYGFDCLSISNYTWTIKNVQDSRNGSEWTCSMRIDAQAYLSSNPTTIYVIVPITSVSIDGNTNVSADAGSQTTVSCTTSTGRPVSTIRWYFDAGTNDTSDDEEITPTSEPVFDFGSETTSGSVTITAESNRNGWGIYATANNTESMTPIQSSNAVTLTVTDSPPKDCKVCCWCKIIPWWWCIILIVISALIGGVGVGTLGYWKYKRIYLFDSPRKWPCSSSKQYDDKSDSSKSQVKMNIKSTEKSDVAHKERRREGRQEEANSPLRICYPGAPANTDQEDQNQALVPGLWREES